MDEEKGRGSRASDADGSIVDQKSHVPPTSHKTLSKRYGPFNRTLIKIAMGFGVGFI